MYCLVVQCIRTQRGERQEETEWKYCPPEARHQTAAKGLRRFFSEFVLIRRTRENLFSAFLRAIVFVLYSSRLFFCIPDTYSFQNEGSVL